MSDASARTVAALVCHDHVDMALDCLGSLLRHCTERLSLRIHDDGTLSSTDVERMCSTLAPCRVVRRAEADERIEDALRGHPAALALRRDLPLALKLFDAPLLHEEPVFAYCDSDVLFLHRCRNPFVLPSSGAHAVFMEDRENCYSTRSWQKLLSHRLHLPSKANTGLICFRRDEYDLDYLEWFVGTSRHRGIPSMLEQTAWAALGVRVGCAKFDPAQICVMREGEQQPRLVAGHFTAKTRHLLPEYVERSRAAPSKATIEHIRTIPAGRCTALNLASFELRRLLKRVGRK